MKLSYQSLFSSFLISLVMVFVLQIPAGAADNYWKSAASTDPKTGTNWSLGSRATTDNLIFDGDSSVVNCTWAAQDTFASRIAKTSYTGTLNDGGQTLYNAGLDSINSGGAVTMTGTLIQTGDASCYLNSAGTWSSAAYNLVLMGTGNLSSGKVITLKSLSCGYTAKTTSFLGTGNLIFSNANEPLIINGGTFAIANGNIYFTMTGTDTVARIALGSTVGTAGQNIQFSFGGNGYIPAYSYTGNVRTSQQGTTSPIVKYAGNITTPTLTAVCASNSQKFILDCNGYNLTTPTSLVFGSPGSAARTTVLLLGSGNHSFGLVDATTNNVGVCSLYCQTSSDTVTGDWKLGSNTVTVPGTSTLNFTGTTKQTCSLATPTAQHLYDVNAPDNAGQLYFGTDVYVDGDIDFDKSFRNATDKDLFVAGDFSFDSAGVTPDTLQIAGLLQVTGNASSVHAAKMVSQNTACTLSVTGTGPTIDMDIATATFAKLKQAATTKSTHTGTGAATYTAGPLLGAMVLNQTGSTTMGHFRLDSLNIAAGTMAVTNHAGADSIGNCNVAGTLDVSGDTVVFTGDVTGAAAGNIIYDASTLWRLTAGAKITGFDGDTLPITQFLGGGGF
jgi:hypothetical protein